MFRKTSIYGCCEFFYPKKCPLCLIELFLYFIYLDIILNTTMEIVRHFLLRTSSVLLVATLLMVSCKNDEQYQENVTEETEEYTFFIPIIL